jgi:hypothetical protein
MTTILRKTTVEKYEAFFLLIKTVVYRIGMIIKDTRI